MSSLRRDPGNLPNVINIGAQKCGTTSLYYYLRMHPEIASCRFKETRFFALGKGPRPGGDHRLNAEGNWHRGLDWYRSQFPDAAPIVFEGFGLGYTDWPIETGVPERIASVIPSPRFIYVVRDPVERAISHWVHATSDSLEDRPVEEALLDSIDDLRANPYVRRSLYGMQLHQYRQVFEDASRYLVITQEELLGRTAETLEAIFRFLGVEPTFRSSEFEVRRHPSSTKRRNTRLGMLVQRLVGDPIYRHLRGHQRHWLKLVLYTPFSRPIARPRLSPQLREILHQRFAADTRLLEELSGRSFPDWNG